MPMKIRCGLYDRVSTELQAQFGLSVDAQKEDLYAYAKSHGYEVVGFFSDEGITARKKLQNRKGFLELMELVKQDKIDLILVTKLDRWFRNVRDYHNTQAILEEHHCNWKTIYEDYDTSTADGQLKINIMLAVAQNECDRTSERIKVVFEHKRRNMEHLTGKPCYGYKSVNKHLVKDEATREIVEEIFRYYFLCFSKRKTVFYILSKYGEQGPTQYQINRILTHEVYAGLFRGKPGYCEPYISLKQHKIILETSQAKTYSTSREPYFFSQLMKCPHCGATMTGFVKTQKLRSGEVHYYKRYRCSRKFSQHPPGACLSESTVEKYMLDHLYPEYEKCICRITQAAPTDTVPDQTPQIRQEMKRLNLLYQKGRIEDDYYETQYRLLEQRLDREAERHTIPTIEDYRQIREQLNGDWKALYQDLDAEHKKLFWKRIIKEIYIDQKTHKICGFSFLTNGCSK